MESTKNEFLSYEEISEKVDKGEKLNPIDQFILDNSPADFDQEEKFRDQLLEAVGYEKIVNKMKTNYRTGKKQLGR